MKNTLTAPTDGLRIIGSQDLCINLHHLLF
jgi:hypothetical protein